MATCIRSSFGVFVRSLFADLFTVPAWQTFLVLAYGWAVAGSERQTITTYLWLSGATQVKHFSGYYTFLGSALYGSCTAILRISLQPENQGVDHGHSVATG